jgi:hypothetical protein
MRAPAAILLIESSVLGLKITLLESGNGADELPPGTPAPTAICARRQPGLFFVLIGFPSASFCAAFRGSFRIALTQSGMAVPGTELIRNERTNWAAVALIL